MFTVSNTVKQCVIGILHELYCRRPVYWIQSCPDSTTYDGFYAMSIIRCSEAPPGAGRVQKLSYHNCPVDGLQRLVIDAAAAQHCDDV